MKKLFVILIILTVIVKSISATTVGILDFRERFMIGLKLGANSSNVYDSKGEQFNTDPKLGFVGGAFVSIPFGKYFGLQPEVLFSQKGFQATGYLLGSSYKFTRTTNFIDVPLLFAFKPIPFLTLLAGPQYSYLLKQKDVFSNSSYSVDQEKEFANDNIRKNILGFVGGVDITVRHLVIGLRTAWDIQKNNGDGTSTTPRYKNVLYQVTIGFRFL